MVSDRPPDSDLPSVVVAAPPALRARVRAALDAAGIIAVFADEEEELPGEQMTRRERDVLALLGDGLGNRAIAERLGISDQTVKFHVASVCGKLDALNRTDAVRRGLQRGLIAL